MNRTSRRRQINNTIYPVWAILILTFCLAPRSPAAVDGKNNRLVESNVLMSESAGNQTSGIVAAAVRDAASHWRRRQGWTMGASALPAGIFRFPELRFWEAYGNRVVLVTTVLILETILIAVLLRERSRRQQAASRLRDSDEQLRLLFEKSKDGLVVTDDGGQFIQTNAAAAELLGFAPDQLLQMNVGDLRPAEPPDSLTRYREYLATGFRAGEWSFIRPDGECRTMRYTMTRYAPGLHLSIVRDVTETRRAEEALRQSESRYRQMFEQNRAVKLLLDPATGQIVDGNPAAAEFYGYSLEQLRSMAIVEITTQSASEIAKRLQQTATGEGYYFLSRHRLASGEIRDVEVHSSPLHLADRTLLYSIVNDITERRRNEERFRRFFELPLVGMAVTSPDRRFLLANKKLCDMLGYSEEEMRKLEWTSVTHEDDIAENIALLEQTLLGETEGYRMEKRFLHREGHVVYASISSRCVRRDDGSVDYLVLIVEDITERRQAELALRESEERFRQLAENIDAVFFMSEGVDRVEPQRVIYVSPAYEKIWGLSRERLYRQQRSWFEGVHPDDRERIAASFPKIAIGEFDEEFRVVRPDGEIRWVHDRVFPIRDEVGQVYRIAGIVEDITDRKIAEERLRHSESKFSGIVSIAADAILSIDGQSRITLFNEGAEQIFGYSSSEIIGERLDVLAPQESRQPDRIHINDFVASPIASRRMGERQEIFARRKSGDEFPAEVSISELELGGERIRTVVLRDITARKQAESRLNQLNAELEGRVSARTADLEAKTREMESFAYSVAHDLKAPLRGIDGYTRLLLSRYTTDLEEDARKTLIKVRWAIQQMNQLIEDLLDYSRIERRSLTTCQIDLEKLVRGVLDDMTHDLLRHDVGLVVDIDRVTVFADSEALMQALRNLLDNAVKFSRDTAAPRIEIGARDTGESCRVWVRDNGIGLDPKFRDRIFELFQRLHGVDEYAGTGIGLALVRKAMLRMGGKVWVESAPGEGATFYLDLPHQFELVNTVNS